jgi:glycogen debranching enzyme
VWGRDGVIIGLAALMTDEPDLHDTFRRTLKTLAENQGPHGEIPSNVDPVSGRISYGGMAGRVDADLWFVIGCGEYWIRTNDDEFLKEMLPRLEKIRFLLGAWEFNTRGLLYIPQTGDWADEYLHHGYVLYDQLLYYQMLKTMAAIHRHFHESEDHHLREKIHRLKHLICTNYWFDDAEEIPEDVYHEILYKKGKKAAGKCRGRFWLPFFSPHGYGYRFDGFSNILASLLDISDNRRKQNVDKYIDDELIHDKTYLIPAFYPVITPVDDDWEDLQMTFSYNFKNQPYEFHNGGRWQMLTGFHVADQAKKGSLEKGKRFLKSIHEANALEMEGEEWSFPEYINGKDFVPGGNRFQGWSAAGALIGHHALEGKEVFQINDGK